MARCNPTKPPSYRLHKATGQAVVTINEKDHYLGRHGTPEIRIAYERLIARWLQAPGEAVATDPSVGCDLTVADLCAQYHRHAAAYCVKDGEETSEMHNVRRAIKTLGEMCARRRFFAPLEFICAVDHAICPCDPSG
jgi:hypothetical protein